MKVLVPTLITETILVDTSAGALIDASPTEIAYPPWVAGAKYLVGQRYAYDGNTYECVSRHQRRTTTPDLDTRFWKLFVAGVDHAEWVSAAAYTTGNVVFYSVTHRVYQALTSHSGVSTTPDLDPTNWLDIGPTNPWAMFDQSTGSRTSATSPLTFTLQPGIVTAIAFLGLVGASSVLVEMYDGFDLIYSHTEDVADTALIEDWYEYFFSEVVPTQDFVLDDMPPYANATIEVTVTGASTVGIGNCAVGNLVTIGPINYGAQVGIIDYSRKETDDFGTTAIVERTYARKIDANIMIENTRLDYVYQKLAALRATPAVWFDESDYQSLILFGFYRDWSVVIPYPENSLVSISLEGLA